MDPNQSQDGSQGGFPGGNIPPYQGGWNPYMYGGFQGHPSWFTQGLQQRPPNVSTMHPNSSIPQVFQPAENADAFVADEVPAEEEQLCPPPKEKGKRTKWGSRIKLQNFNPDEDVNLVKSWLEISGDPITSNGQKKEAMWDRILQRYNLRRKSADPERTKRSLQSRWDIIKAEVGLFAAYYADAIRENPSGMSDADKTTHAAANFAAVIKHNFAYLHCWELMKDEPKWQDPKSRASGKAARGDGFGEDTINLVDDNSSPTGSDDKRPPGRDGAKVAKKKANSSAGSTASAEYAARLQNLSLRRISIMQEDMALKNDRFQQQQSIEDRRYEEMRSHHASLLQIEQDKNKLEQDKFQFMREERELERQEKAEQEEERIMVLTALRHRVATHPLTTPRRLRRAARRRHRHILNIQRQ